MSTLAHPTLTTPVEMPAATLAVHAGAVATRPSQAIVAAAAATSPYDGWLLRLAAWAERRPAHRRLGSWTLTR